MSTEQPVPEPPTETPAEPTPDPAPPDWFTKIPYDPDKGARMEIVSDAIAAIRSDDATEARGPGAEE
jgi:hypothetical protein